MKPRSFVTTSALLLGLCTTGTGLLHAQIRFKPPQVRRGEEAAPATQTEEGNAQGLPEAGATGGQADSLGDLPDSAVALPIPDSIVIPQLDFSNQPIQDVLRLLSAPYGINLAVDPGLKANVTLRLTDVRLKDALKFIVEQNGFAFRVTNGIISVYKPTPPPPPAPKPPPPPPDPIKVFEFSDGKLTVDIGDASLDSVIRRVAERTGRNLIPEKGLKGSLTAFFKDVPIDKGLKILFETNGYEIVAKEGLTYVLPAGGGFDSRPEDQSGRVRHFVTVRDRLVSFNVNNASIGGIIKEVARQADLDVYMYADIPGTVTAKVTDMPIDELFESLLRNTPSTYWYSKGVYYFGSRDMYEKKVIEMVHINYLKAAEIAGLLPKNVTSKATIREVKEYNALLIEAPTSDVIEQAKAFVAMVDKPIAQILIEAWVVEVKLDKARDLGVKLFGKGKDYQERPRKYFPTVSYDADRSKIVRFLEEFVNVSSRVTRIIPEDFAAQIDLLESEGISNLISKPQIATLNGHAANITFGTTQYFLLQKEVIPTGVTGEGPVRIEQRYETVNVNMTLSVTPWVSGNNEVTMDISPQFDVPGTSPDDNIPPPINRRSLQSKVRVRDGEMIVLGGLIGESKNQSMEQVPFLGSIPIIKYFFSTRKTVKSKTQLMIYLIPHIYYGSERTVDPDMVEKGSYKMRYFLSEKHLSEPKRRGHYWRRRGEREPEDESPQAEQKAPSSAPVKPQSIRRGADTVVTAQRVGEEPGLEEGKSARERLADRRAEQNEWIDEQRERGGLRRLFGSLRRRRQARKERRRSEKSSEAGREKAEKAQSEDTDSQGPEPADRDEAD